MESNRYKVLVDLSLAVLGNSGIPLDTKWLFKQLKKNNKLDVNGLIYPLDWQNYNFSIKDKKHLLLKYSQYMGMMSNIGNGTASSFDRFKLLRWYRRLGLLLKTYVKKNFKLWKKETLDYNDVVYRLFFESGLDPKDKDLILGSDFYLTDFFRHAIYSRVLSPIPTLTPSIDTRGFDFVIHQDSVPVKLSPGTQKIIRYHDPIPLLSPDFFDDTINNATFHYRSIQKCIKQGAIYVCNSEPVEQELLNIFPELKGRTATIPYTISDVYTSSIDHDMLFDILESKVSSKFSKYHSVWRSGITKARQNPKSFRYITEIATIEPRKNYSRLLKAFSLAKSKLKQDNINLKLIIAGGLGWKYEKIIKDLELLIEKGDVALMENLHPNELKYLYSHADSFIFPTLKEGFGLPPVEAMLCGTPVISSDIKVHRWVQGDSSFYVDPYNYEDIAEKIVYVVKNRESSDIKTRIRKGIDRAKRYSAIENEKKWNNFFDDFKMGKFKV